MEETVAYLMLIIFNLQGQVLDMAEKSNDQSEDIKVVNFFENSERSKVKHLLQRKKKA